MILVDTSIWIDHFRHGDTPLAALLDTQRVLTHPFVIGELALGTLQQRDIILSALQDLPQASVASDSEILHFIGDQSLFGLGIGYIDAHLLASARLTPDTTLWTRDKRLFAVAARLSLAADVARSD